MEWKKDEAVKAKEIAEEKIMEMDISTAQRFARIARNLYPGLDGLPQLLATIDIYASAEKKINGEVDWYKVLSVEPSADDDTIRKSFRRLALALHPDKNKAVGADGAFKILSEAWSNLSNKLKRSAYDQRRDLRSLFQRVQNGRFTVPNYHNGFYDAKLNSQDFSPNCWRGASHSNTASAPAPSPMKRTFWTACAACKVQFEFLRDYVNCHLRCPTCRYSFVAIETPPPPIDASCSFASSGMKPNSNEMRMNTSGEAASADPDPAPSCHFDSSNKFSPPHGMLPEFGSAGRFPSASSSVANSRKTCNNNLSKSTFSGVLPKFRGTGSFRPSPSFQRRKKGVGESTTPILSEETHQQTDSSKKTCSGSVGISLKARVSSPVAAERSRKRKLVVEVSANCNERDVASQMVTENGGSGPGNSFTSQKVRMETGKVKTGGTNWPKSTTGLSYLDSRSVLIEKAKKEIQKKISLWRTEKQVADKSNPSKIKAKKHGEKKTVASDEVNADASERTEHTNRMGTSQVAKSSPTNLKIGSDTEFSVKSMSVSDPDFYDFDQGRVESSFRDNQVWAAYDDDDGMPRYYAIIHRVISHKPFKMQISWLSSKSNQEFGPLRWVESGFPKTCGDLRIRKYEVYDSLNSFSHEVKWKKGPRGVIQIYPVKGDVWALYKNWSPDWNEFTPDDVIHNYDMVEILGDYTEECGVTVTPLIKVCGFKTVFQKHPDCTKIWTIPREEMFRFSHQVPSHMLTGEEGLNAPKGFWELDPASTPQELLHVVTETKKEEDLMVGSKRSNDEELLNNQNITEETAGLERHKMETKRKKLLVYERRCKGRKQSAQT